ncbi:dihydropteroate synthase, partial [Salinisphaera sp. USBA-960]|nr:dihydropteroate synthase [Salifodinibacter halophilus]
FSPEVAREALRAGADIINDTSGLRDPRLIEEIAAAGAYVVLMHIAGPPRTWRPFRHYSDVTAEVAEFLEERVEAAAEGGIEREKILLDPG